MASRRMFSRAITGSGRFLRLSAQARALYYDLGMEADDDGFVEAFVRLRATGAEEDHLRELERAGLILILDICVGAIVACTMYGFYALFARGEI